MLFRNSHALVAEQDRDAVNRHPCLEQLNGKSVSESVRVRRWNSRKNEQSLQRSLPVPDCALRVEKYGEGYRIGDVWVSRDRRQYGGDDSREEAELLSFLIGELLSSLE
jgi:hypothetical protein